MSEDYPLLIVDKEATGQLAVTSPFDGSEIGSVGVADADAVEHALSMAYGLYRDRSVYRK